MNKQKLEKIQKTVLSVIDEYESIDAKEVREIISNYK